MFGATGGRLFIEGCGWRPFCCRNSGATAVVEGVGDFCAEYMTNGAVLNLGPFSKGFGIGMSGGFAYQYDPHGDFKNSISHDSVLLGSLSEDTDESKIHADAIKVLLSWHIEATNSKLAINLLENWETEKSNFSYITPKAILQYQDSDAILEAKSRKELLEELAVALATHQVNKLKKAWRSGDAVIKGQVPVNMSSDTDNMYELLNTYAVLDAAQKLALKKFDSNLSIDHPDVVKTTRNLILTEDYALMNLLLRHRDKQLQII